METRSTYISVKSGEIASTSISPVMFPWFEKCRNRVISRRTRLANCIFSKTRVTSLIATVSPDISSAAELWGKFSDIASFEEQEPARLY